MGFTAKRLSILATAALSVGLIAGPEASASPTASSATLTPATSGKCKKKKGKAKKKCLKALKKQNAAQAAPPAQPPSTVFAACLPTAKCQPTITLRCVDCTGGAQNPTHAADTEMTLGGYLHLGAFEPGKEAGEPVTIAYLQTPNTYYATVYTDANGNFRFSYVPGGGGISSSHNNSTAYYKGSATQETAKTEQLRVFIPG